MIRKILPLILILHFFYFATFAGAESIQLNQEQSRINYTLSYLGIPVKRKFLPIYGQVNINSLNPGQTKIHKPLLLQGINLTCKFISKDTLFRKIVDYNKYPDFNFSSYLERPVVLANRKPVELEGNLTFQEKSRKVKIKLQNKSKKGLVILRGSLNIKMTDFGLVPPRILLLPLDNVIKTKIELRTQ